MRAAAELFDADSTAASAWEFLERPGHHLLIACCAQGAGGIRVGVEITGKGTEMFQGELGVSESFRRRGVGRSFVQGIGGPGPKAVMSQHVGAHRRW